MRRHPFLLALLAAVVIGSFVYQSIPQDRWRSLPDGGEIRLVAVTYEKNAHVKIGGSIFEPLRSRLGSRWGYLLGPPTLALDAPPGRQKLDRSNLVVWFTTRRVGNNNLPEGRFTLLLGDEQILSNLASYNKLISSEGGRELIGLAFDTAPCAEQRLYIRFEKGGRTLEFEADNPLYPTASHLVPNTESKPPDPPLVQ